MKRKLILATVLFCMLMVPFWVTGEALAIDRAWVVCDVVRIGSNAEHGYAYLELTSAGPHEGVFSNVIFQIDESIRKEGLATALTALSLDEYIRVLVTTDQNPMGYQILKAVYTYVP
jgi:hypothetical protein